MSIVAPPWQYLTEHQLIKELKARRKEYASQLEDLRTDITKRSVELPDEPLDSGTYVDYYAIGRANTTTSGMVELHAEMRELVHELNKRVVSARVAVLERYEALVYDPATDIVYWEGQRIGTATRGQSWRSKKPTNWYDVTVARAPGKKNNYPYTQNCNGIVAAMEQCRLQWLQEFEWELRQWTNPFRPQPAPQPAPVN